jgi:pimeloyl-ACP methyl ester carboxylesterase
MRFSSPWTGPEAQLRTMPGFPSIHIAMAYAHRLSDPNPAIKRLPDGSVDWEWIYYPRGWDGTYKTPKMLWKKILAGAWRRLADPYERRTTVPTFIVHGTENHTIPSYVSGEMVLRLRNWDVECDIIEAEGFGHGFDFVFEETDPE